MTNKKMTEKEIFALVGANAEVFGDKADLIAEWVEKHIGQLDRKYSSKNGKPTAKQVENEGIKEKLASAISEVGRPVRVMDLVAYESFEAYTPQKITALLKQMVDDKVISKYTEKRVTYFVPYDEKYDVAE